MATKEETTIVQECLHWLLHNYGRGWHVSGSILQPTGEPDIDGYIRSFTLKRMLHLKIEIKTPTGIVSRKQELRLLEYKQAGYVTGIATSIFSFIKVIRDYETEHKTSY